MGFRFTELSEAARKVAVEEFIYDCKWFFQTELTFEEGYKTLLEENEEHLYDDKGVLISNGGMY